MKRRKKSGSGGIRDFRYKQEEAPRSACCFVIWTSKALPQKTTFFPQNLTFSVFFFFFEKPSLFIYGDLSLVTPNRIFHCY